MAQSADVASRLSGSVIVHAFQQGQGDGFFRPIGMLSLWLTFPAAGTDSFAWHLPGFLLHAANTTLVFKLAQNLYGRQALSLTAALLFAVHGSRPEAVSWMASRFDLLSALFVLLSLLCMADLRMMSSVVFAALAMLSKEAAFCLPLVATLLLLSSGWTVKRAILASVPLALTAGLLFAYRWTLFQGIGGYVDSTGHSTVAAMRVLPVSKALLLRIWTVLLFPVNWTIEPGLALTVGFAFGGMGMLLTVRAHVARGTALPLWAATIASAVPALPLLLIGTDLSNARVLYIPSICFSLLLDQRSVES